MIDIKKIEKALGKKRMAKVDSIFDDGSAVDLQLKSLEGDCWEYKTPWGHGDFSFAEIVFYMKKFIDEGGHI